MQNDWYMRLIQSLCEHAGINDWQTVAQIQQIEVNGFVVALFEDAEALDALAMYVELSSSASDNDLHLLRELLESNTVVGGIDGFFGLVPYRGTIAFRTSVRNASTVSSEELTATIARTVSVATTRFHEVVSRHAQSDISGKPNFALSTSRIYL